MDDSLEPLLNPGFNQFRRAGRQILPEFGDLFSDSALSGQKLTRPPVLANPHQNEHKDNTDGQKQRGKRDLRGRETEKWKQRDSGE
jgi:hypothetical protein